MSREKPGPPASIAAFAGWPDVALPAGAWAGTDARGRALGLAGLAEVGTAPASAAANERRTVHAVLAGAIYNRRELGATLAGRHALGRGDDAEIIVHLYEERGLRCVRALRGAFALALWDDRRQRLVLARDQVGVVPLYYAIDRDALVAASQLPLLVGLPGLGDVWDPAALDAFVTFGGVPAPATLYPAIRQLGPGEMAVWEDGRLRTQRYWQLTFPERRMASGELPALFRTQVLEAVRLRQAGVVSAHLLSGGLAAATIIALATEDRRPPARAYTLAPDPADDDARLAEGLARKLGVRHTVLADPLDWAGALDRLLARAGGPMGGPEVPALHAMAARAAADGLPVALAGVGAQEIFGGAPPARWAERVRRYRGLPRLAREVAEVWVRLGAPRWTGSLRRLIAHERLAPLEMYARSVSLVQPEERAALYTPDALQAMGDARPWAALTELFAAAVSAGASDTADAIHYVELGLRLPARAVATTAVDVDLRLPLVDHRLAQFAASAPAPARGTASERQLLLRGAMADLLPPEILARPHASPVPGAAWAEGALRALVEEVLAPARVAGLGVFRPEAVMRLWREHLAGERDHGARLWAILLASRWLDRRRLAAAPTLRAAG